MKTAASLWKRLLPVIAAGVALICLAAGYLRLTYHLSVGEGPAGPTVAREAFQKPWSDRQVLLVGLGDSITAGFGARPGYGYFDRLIANPADEFQDLKGLCLSSVFPHLRATNVSYSGSISAQLIDSQLPRLPVAGPGVVGWIVITTGGNDLIHNYGKRPPREHAMYGATLDQAQPWVANYQQRLEAMVAALNERFPAGCHIFLANIYDPSDATGNLASTGLRSWPDGLKVHAAYNGIISKTARSHPNVHVVDLYSAFLGHGLHCRQFWSKHYDRSDPHYWFNSNLEDPNERGYDAIRRLFLNEMVRVAGSLKH